MKRVLDFIDGFTSLTEPVIESETPVATFTIANNQSAATDVTDFTADGLVHDVIYMKYSVKRTDDLPTNSWDTGVMVFFFINGSWDIEEAYKNGNDTGVTFSAVTTTNTLQVQYTSTNYTGASYTGSLKYTLERFTV